MNLNRSNIINKIHNFWKTIYHSNNFIIFNKMTLKILISNNKKDKTILIFYTKYHWLRKYALLLIAFEQKNGIQIPI